MNIDFTGQLLAWLVVNLIALLLFAGSEIGSLARGRVRTELPEIPVSDGESDQAVASLEDLIREVEREDSAETAAHGQGESTVGGGAFLPQTAVPCRVSPRSGGHERVA